MPAFTDHSPAPFPFGSCVSLSVIVVIATLFGLMRMKNPGDGIDPKPESRDDPEFSSTTIGTDSPGLFVDVGFSVLTDFEPTLDEERPSDADLPRPLEIFHSSPVPPFLSKTYEIVDDVALNPIISWGCSGQSFVVWDPVEFARVVLPRNFKHNNFSSFARQLNTYGFRKVDADRWEFANEGFERGKRHLLKNIQRRKSPQSQQQPGCYSGLYIEKARPGVESEVEKLKTEKTILMKEVIELQQQQRGTAHHAQAVSQRIQVAEQKQKQMVSFLAKLLKNPSFVERLKESKEQKKMGSSKSKRKFLEHGRTEWDEANPFVEGQVVENHSWGNLDDSSCFFMQDPVCSYLPEFVSEDWIGMRGDSGTGSSQTSDFWSRDPFLPHDSSSVQGYFQNPPLVGEGSSSMVAAWDTKDKSPITSGEPQAAPEYFVSFPENLEGKRSFTGFLSGFESIVKQEEIWSMGFDVSATMSSPGGEPWDNIPPFNEPVQGVTAGLSDIWDLGQLPASRELGSDNWPEEPESEADQQKDSSTSKENDP